MVVHDVYPRRMRVQLAWAIEVGDLAGVKAALSRFADPNSEVGPADLNVIAPNQNMLTFASMKHNAHIVEALIKAGARVNRADRGGRTPLVSAIYTNDEAIALALLAAGAEPRQAGTGLNGPGPAQTPMEAVSAAGLRAIRAPYSQGSLQSTSADLKAVYRALRDSGASPTLAQAIAAGDLDSVQSLARSGADVNAAVPSTDIPGLGPKQTMLTLAVTTHSEEVVRELIKSGADVNRYDLNGRSPLVSAIASDDEPCTALLLAAGANPKLPAVQLNYSSKVTPMEQVASFAQSLANSRYYDPVHYKQYSGMCRRLYQMLRLHGAVPTLTQAVRAGDVAEVKAQIARGVSVDALDESGVTPLIDAVDCLNVDMVRILLEAGASAVKRCKYRNQLNNSTIAAMDNISQAAFYAATLHLNRDPYQSIYQLLCRHGATPTLSQAIDIGDSGKIDNLISRGASLSESDASHGSALAVAADVGDKPLVSRLLRAGADANLGDPVHRSALQVAKSKTDKELLRMLTNPGAQTSTNIGYH